MNNQPPDQLETIDLSESKKPPKFSKKKMIIVLAIVLMAIGLSAAAFLYFKKTPANQSAVQPQPAVEEELQTPVATEKKRIRFIATGDMIAHDAINKEAEQSDGSYDYSAMFGTMKPLFDDADIRFCNQAVLGGGAEFGVKGYPIFNSPTEFARDMNELGCNVVNTGTNHTNDLTQAVVDASVAAWDKLPNMLAVAGANRSSQEMQTVRYFEVKGVRFAFVSYTTYSNKPSPSGYSVTMYDQALAQRQLQEARQNADIVIASMRWGTEYSQDVNQQQRSLAKTVADLGADIIVGHGPHVLEPVERIATTDGREAIAWYSLGNFLNAQLEPEALFNGIATMDINPDTKKIEAVGYLPIYMHYEWTAAEKAREDLLARKNFSMYTFEDGQGALGRSQIGTSFEAQRQRIESTLNKLAQIKLLTREEFLQS